MSFAWQDVAALALVHAAVLYVVWRLRRSGRGKGHGNCGTCGNCTGTSASLPHVSLDPPTKDAL